MGGVPVHVQAGGRVPAAVPPLAVPLSTGLAHVVRCLPGKTSLQHFFIYHPNVDKEFECINIIVAIMAVYM